MEKIIRICCDITNNSQLEKADQIVNTFGGLDILVSNAGATEGSISNMNESIFRQSMELNLFSHFYASKKAIKIFHAQDYFENNEKK